MKIAKYAGFVLAFAFAFAFAAANANSNFEQLERWRPEVSGEQFVAGVIDRVVAKTPSHFIVEQDAGTSCAAGSHWLFNVKQKSYRPLDSGTCDDRRFKVILRADKVIFMSGKKITAQYPVYQ